MSISNGNTGDTKKILAILKAQSQIILNNAERIMMLQSAFEAYTTGLIQGGTLSKDDHYKLRKEIYDDDMKKSNDLLCTLQTMLDTI